MLVLADHSHSDYSVSVPMQVFLNPGEGHTFSYVATGMPGSDSAIDKSWFNTVCDWAVEQSPRFATGVLSYIVGSAIADVLDSEAAGAMAHFATDRIAEEFK